MLADERFVHPSREPHLEEQGLQERDVGPRFDRQVEVGNLRRPCPPRIHHDHLHVVAATALPRLDAIEQDWVAGLDVRPEDEERVRLLDVRERSRGRVAPEGEVVGGDRAGHAEARVRVLVVGPDVALGELAEEVVVLRVELARAVEHDRVRAVPLDCRTDAAGHAINRVVPGSGGEGATLAHTNGRSQEAVLRLEDGGEKGALRAQATPVHRMVGVALDLRDHPIAGLGQDPAARAAVAADGAEPVRAAAFSRHRRLARGLGAGFANAHRLAAA